MSKVFLKKGDVQICWGNIVNFPKYWPQAMVLDFIQTKKQQEQEVIAEIYNRIVARTEGLLMGLGYRREKIEEFISLMRQEMVTMLERDVRVVKLEKMIELLEEGWIYDKED